MPIPKDLFTIMYIFKNRKGMETVTMIYYSDNTLLIHADRSLGRLLKVLATEQQALWLRRTYLSQNLVHSNLYFLFSHTAGIYETTKIFLCTGMSSLSTAIACPAPPHSICPPIL